MRMDVTPKVERGIMVLVTCPHGHTPDVIKIPSEGDETPLDVYFRMMHALHEEGAPVPEHYQPYGYTAA